MEKLRILFFTGIIFSSFIWHGISYGGVGAIPTFQELKGKPGQKLRGSYTVYNTGDAALEVDVYYEEYFKMEENKQITTKDWLHVRPMRFTLNPQGKREVKFIARVPERAVGEVMSLIFFKAASTAGSNIMMSFGVALYVRTEGTEVVKGEVSDIDFARVVVPTGSAPPQYNIKVKVKDNGNVHLRPQIKVDIYNDRKVIKTVEFVFGWPVFPENSYEYLGSWKEEEYKLQTGSYMAEAEVTFEGQMLKRKTAFFVDEQGNIFMKKVKGQ